MTKGKIGTKLCYKIWAGIAAYLGCELITVWLASQETLLGFTFGWFFAAYLIHQTSSAIKALEEGAP